jgi:tellurite resistance protein TerC
MINAGVLASSTRTQFVDIDVAWWVWLALGAAVVVLLLLDVAVLNREARMPSARRALLETGCWVAVGLGFGLVVLGGYGGGAATEYYSGYLVELSLSIDNVFVWALIMSYFVVPKQYQHRVLFWGIVGAVVLRGAFIFTGVAIVNRAEWVLIGFGVFLLYTAFRLLKRQDESEIDPNSNVFMRLLRRLVPSTDVYDGQRLWTRREGRRVATPLFAVVVMVGTTDVLFAVDSVPAVLGVSRESFIVLTSNAFAIMGLRALYFLIADLHERFEYLQFGLAVILGFVGLKMIIAHWVEVPTSASLLVIVVVLALAVAASVRRDRDRARAAGPGDGTDSESPLDRAAPVADRDR